MLDSRLYRPVDPPGSNLGNKSSAQVFRFRISGVVQLEMFPLPLKADAAFSPSLVRPVQNPSVADARALPFLQ
jgi:hypothetical protein